MDVRQQIAQKVEAMLTALPSNVFEDKGRFLSYNDGIIQILFRKFETEKIERAFKLNFLLERSDLAADNFENDNRFPIRSSRHFDRDGEFFIAPKKIKEASTVEGNIIFFFSMGSDDETLHRLDLFIDYVNDVGRRVFPSETDVMEKFMADQVKERVEPVFGKLQDKEFVAQYLRYKFKEVFPDLEPDINLPDYESDFEPLTYSEIDPKPFITLDFNDCYTVDNKTKAGFCSYIRKFVNAPHSIAPSLKIQSAPIIESLLYALDAEKNDDVDNNELEENAEHDIVILGNPARIVNEIQRGDPDIFEKLKPSGKRPLGPTL